MKIVLSILLILTSLFAGCQQTAQQTTTSPALVGAWKAKMQFTSGAYAPIKDLELMYVFNVGGTMTESSNYDGAPPVPPAYGIWKATAPHTYTARYEFYMTRPPDTAEVHAGAIGWLPAGEGILTETITMADDGKSFTSKIILAMFDQSGKPIDGGGNATSEGTRIDF